MVLLEGESACLPIWDMVWQGLEWASTSEQSTVAVYCRKHLRSLKKAKGNKNYFLLCLCEGTSQIVFHGFKKLSHVHCRYLGGDGTT